MGTRTWTRRGVLTAAGRRRAGVEQVSFSVNAPTLPVTFDAPSRYAPRPVSASTFAKGGQFETTLRGIVLAAIQAGDITPPRTNITAEEYAKQMETADLPELMDAGANIAQAMLYQMVGYNAPPTIETWEDIEAGKGLATFNGIPLMGYRGLTARGRASSKIPFPDWATRQYTDDLRYGSTHWVGHGLQGKGTYIALLPIADTVTNVFGTPINPTIKNRQKTAKHQAGNYTEGSQPTAMAIGLKRGARTNLRDVANAATADSATDVIDQEFKKRYGFTIPNGVHKGIYATALGYDAISVLGSAKGSMHMAILNRGKMVVSSTDRKAPDAGFFERINADTFE